MKPSPNLTSAIEACMVSRRFSLCHLYEEDHPMDIHVHDCYEVYYAISGGASFLIGDHLYEMNAGDLFFLNINTPHHVLIEDGCHLERIQFFIHPDFIRSISTDETPMSQAYLDFVRPCSGVSVRYSLSEEQQRRFLYHADQLVSTDGYGSDILENCRMAEFLVYLNRMIRLQTVLLSQVPIPENIPRYMPQVKDALDYINEHIQEPLTLTQIADHLYLSESYLCRIFKNSTGTTVSKYITGRRISIAKGLLASGYSVTAAQERCGFNDYSNFLKAFSRLVGMSPKKYQYTVQQASR